MQEGRKIPFPDPPTQPLHVLPGFKGGRVTGTRTGNYIKSFSASKNHDLFTKYWKLRPKFFTLWNCDNFSHGPNSFSFKSWSRWSECDDWFRVVSWTVWQTCWALRGLRERKQFVPACGKERAKRRDSYLTNKGKSWSRMERRKKVCRERRDTGSAFKKLSGPPRQGSTTSAAKFHFERPDKAVVHWDGSFKKVRSATFPRV